MMGVECRLSDGVFFSLCDQDLKEEIDIRLSRVQDIKYEPQLLADDDARLLQLETQGNLSTQHAPGEAFSRESLGCRVPLRSES